MDGLAVLVTGYEESGKKELIGDFANGGAAWRPKGEPTRVNVHDFADRALGGLAKAIPYGIYDVGNDEGWVSVGDISDTAEFAVASIRRWWATPVAIASRTPRS